MKQMAAVKRIGALCGVLVLAAGLILSGCEQPSGGGGGGGSEPPVVKKGLSFSKSQATVYAGGKVRLYLSVEGDISYDDIAVETDDWNAPYRGGIVTVTAPAGAKKGDSVTVTAYYRLDKAVKSSCTVTVIEEPEGYIPVTNITISGTLEGMKIGDSKTLTAVVTPTNATSKNALFWGSSDPAVATVSQDGTVTVVGYGEAEIFAAADLAESNKIPVSVKIDTETLTLEKTKWRSNIWEQNDGVKFCYNLWFVDDERCAIEVVFGDSDFETESFYGTYSVKDSRVIVNHFAELVVDDFGLKIDTDSVDILFRQVAYTEPPKIITLDLAKTKWTGDGDNVTVWFIDDTQFVWNREGEIITGDFTKKDGMITLGSQGIVFILSETQFRDGEGHKYTKTEWTPPPEKSALAGTKWQSSWYSESDQTTYNYTIWFIDDNFVCFQMGGNDMYGTYSVSGQSLSMFGLVEAILNKDSISIPEGSIPGIFSSLKFLEAEYTSPVYSFGENPLADTSWTEVMSGNYVSFNEDYTCSWQLGTEQKLTGIYYFTRQEYNGQVKEWVTTINPENTQGWASFDINRGNDGSITSLVGNDDSLFYKE